MMDSGTTFEGTVGELHSSIRHHYDGLLDMFEELWGEHIHHGFRDEDAPKTGRKAAIERTIDELVRFANLSAGAKLIDIGCGTGGTAIYLSRKLDADVRGVTIVEPQVERARNKLVEAGIADRVSIEQADGMDLPYDDGSFDIVWALESTELMPDKRAFLAECIRVLRPGGVIVASTVCCREGELEDKEIRRLRRIYRDNSVAYMLRLSEYIELCAGVGFEDIRSDDWTANTSASFSLGSEIVKPFLRNPRFLWQLVRRKGLQTVRFLRAVPLMRDAYASGLLRYGVFTARKPLL